MSEVTDGILAMPFEMAMGTEVARRQFHGCAVAEIGRLKAELSSLWETVNNTIAKLGIDCVAAQSAPGKPSDVLAEHVNKLAAELECARGDLKTAMEIVERNQKDAERLEWLDARSSPIVEGQSLAQPEGELWGYEWAVSGQCGTVREAIDYMMDMEDGK